MFSDLKVVELASVLAGPSVGQFFAELGAEVIKIENLKSGGDVTRTWKVAGESDGDLSAYFCSCNWGKKSVALDLSTKAGCELARKLTDTADIVIASYKPGDAKKLGVSYEQLSVTNPRLVYGQVSGYGSDNERVGYDAVIQAETGFMDLNGEKEGAPMKMPVALIDILAAHQLKEGLLVALLKRERSGKGSLVEVSLVQSAVASLANQATNWLMTKKLPVRQGSVHPNIAPYGETFTTMDKKRILLAVGTDKQFGNLCALLELPPGIQRELSTNQSRVRSREVLSTALSPLIAKWQSSDLLLQLNKLKIPAGLVQNLQEVFEMPEAKELILQAGYSLGIRNYVVKEGDSNGITLLPPPHFGQHTEEILKGL